MEKNLWFVPRKKGILLYGRRAQIQHGATAPANKEKAFGVDTEWQGVTTQLKCCPLSPATSVIPGCHCLQLLPDKSITYALWHTVSPGSTWGPSPRKATPSGMHVWRECTGCTDFRGSLDKTGLGSSQAFLERQEEETGGKTTFSLK